MQFLIILILTLCFNGLKPSSVLIAFAIHVGINALVKLIVGDDY